MNERSSLYWKIAYGVGIAVLMLPLAWLSAPATQTVDPKTGLSQYRPGGKLAELRKANRLSQANLGEVDPASETIKLATLGLRGIAVNLLWEKANNYKMKEDWTNLTATLEQLAKLQPNFITFWKFQAWNLSYNVSVEFDDYHDRYYYVRRGIQFLTEGERHNVDNPQLLWDLGWFVGQKIGRADEHVQYRRLFKEDEEFHPSDRSPDQRDNWLVGKEWYLKGVDAVNNRNQSIGKKSPRIYFSSPAMSQINYADAIEEEGYFEKARRAWIKAADEWRQFGELVIEHSTGVPLRLGEPKRLEKEIAELRAKLDALLPGAREQVAKEKSAALPEEDRKLLDTPPAEIKPEQLDHYGELQAKLLVTDRDVAEHIAREKPAEKNQAMQLASELQRTDQRLDFTNNYRRDSNYDYWENRCAFEQTPNALAARELMFRAKQAFRDKQDLNTAKKLYDEGFAKWKLVIDEFPMIIGEDATTGDDLLDYIKAYRQVLDQMEETIGEDFPLWVIIENFDKEQNFTEDLTRHRQIKSGITPTSTPAPTEVEPSPAEEVKTPPADAAATPPAGEATTPSAGETATPPEK